MISNIFRSAFLTYLEWVNDAETGGRSQMTLQVFTLFLNPTTQMSPILHINSQFLIDHLLSSKTRFSDTI